MNRTREELLAAFDYQCKCNRGYLPASEQTIAEIGQGHLRDQFVALLDRCDAEYSRGYSDAEKEISQTALGRANTALHEQLMRAKGKDVPNPHPANCRERLRAEGKPYPRSSCGACGANIRTGLLCKHGEFK